MSEYQYHEWQTIDRVLTPEEQSAVSSLSSHMEVNSHRAVVTYNWSDFRHDPKQVLVKYFDAYFYLANWGTLQLMFRFPKGSLDEASVAPYIGDEMVSFETIGKHEVLDIHFEPEDGGWGTEETADLSDFVSLREDLLLGDYRLLYLAWLKEMSFFGMPDSEEEGIPDANALEPPVPPGLKKLSPALAKFIEVFDIDPFLVEAAAEASPDPGKSQSVDYRDLIARLPRSECDDFLARLAEGEAGVGAALRKRLRAFLPHEDIQVTGKRSFQQIQTRADQLEIVEKERREKAARKKHFDSMKDLAKREPQVWKQVEDLLENNPKNASVYDQATNLLESLEMLSDFKNTPDQFQSGVRGLGEKYASRPSLIKRWKEKGWL